ncbi:ATP-binding cassette domain-containing protein [Mesorhizobium sp. YIM 152430]|uniref:ATP-binding cassette domain-containing protein n=1 Tax=Mesorhizobium sp. YIM 152430 TaxID=3031761 RepID=UPI0023DA7317|nr:ATP-binding cassette domain-containing protein [Mesorhizobium sp. YIM 152430]MBL0937202.1 ATP-binding cassette domain-containing protein [Rhizobiaceae bacterium]MDF1599170.1 ATP-binding cassette domain-containing protein [Mesorhizobium sp. YIM 152430]
MTVEPILSTTALEKRFGGVRAVAGVDFSLQPGELRCLIGPNGAGKSTFFKMISGQLKPTSGEIRIAGHDMLNAEAYQIARSGIGIKNQVPDVMNGLSVRENLWLAAASRHRGAAIGRSVDRITERLALTAILDRLVGELAHGQRQWVEIGMVIVCEPRIVLLDEPAAGMSDEETVLTAELIREINKDMTIVVVEHDMQFIRRIARTVTVFHQGRILIEDSFDKIAADPTVREVYLGRSGGT